MTGTNTFEQEVRAGDRFEFGRNWRAFLTVLNDERIALSEANLREMLGVESLAGKRFLDIGSGSGLSSLAARRLGATVTSFDFDPSSVACTEELRRRYFPDDPQWTVLRGSATDRAFVSSLGQFDVVYSWGVLHHTGDMWTGLELATLPVAPGGHLFVAIYNDQGWKSTMWKGVKKAYCSSPIGKAAVCAAFLPLYVAQGAVEDLRKARNPVRRYREPTARGMSIYHDWFDWLGGLPFEVASTEALVAFYDRHGFDLVRKRLTTSLGNNQLVFVRR